MRGNEVFLMVYLVLVCNECCFHMLQFLFYNVITRGAEIALGNRTVHLYTVHMRSFKRRIVVYNVLGMSNKG